MIPDHHIEGEAFPLNILILRTRGTSADQEVYAREI
jgi:hypothetical protein